MTSFYTRLFYRLYIFISFLKMMTRLGFLTILSLFISATVSRTAWNTQGVIFQIGHPKHMGVYSGRPVKNNPQASLTLSPIVRHKTISLAYVNQKLNEFLLSRQVKDSPDPLIKININNTNDLIKSLGFTFKANDDYAAPRSYSDILHIDNAPPAPNIILGANDHMGIKFSHSMSDMQTFFNKFHWVRWCRRR